MPKRTPRGERSGVGGGGHSLRAGGLASLHGKSMRSGGVGASQFGISEVSTHTGLGSDGGLSSTEGLFPSMSIEEAHRLTSLLEGGDGTGTLPRDFDWAQSEHEGENVHEGFQAPEDAQGSMMPVGQVGLNVGGLQVSSPEEVLRDVKKFVRERKPWLMEVDDTLLEKRRGEERSAETNCFIILPDNRVRCMDDQLDWRIKAQVLGHMEVAEGQNGFEGSPASERAGAAQANREQQLDHQEKPAQRKKVRNPWYMAPTDWYDEKMAKLLQESSSQQGDDLRSMISPYENLSNYTDKDDPAVPDMSDPTGPAAGVPAEERPRRLTQNEKEILPICEKYRKYLVQEGGRLPHFLI